MWRIKVLLRGLKKKLTFREAFEAGDGGATAAQWRRRHRIAPFQATSATIGVFERPYIVTRDAVKVVFLFVSSIVYPSSSSKRVWTRSISNVRMQAGGSHALKCVNIYVCQVHAASIMFSHLVLSVLRIPPT